MELVAAEVGIEFSQATWPAEDWNFIVLVREGNEVRVHVNGSPHPVLKSSIDSRLPADAEFAELRLADELQGKLDEVALFPRALSDTELTQLWETGMR
ncbi:MAG: LamG-like jellyroll fold domain-containing protein [Pirellulaceae bacterium]